MQTETRYRWYILLLSAATSMLTVAIPSMCLSVLFEEISIELHLDLVQVGLIWGIAALPGIATVLLGGVIGDRFGPRRILIVGCVLVGVAGALRGLAHDFVGLLVLAFVFGTLSPMIQSNVLKTVGLWFRRAQLGIATGVISMAMALGFMISALLSASVLSPLLGGWRQVLFLYGGLGALLAVPWYFSKPIPRALTTATMTAPTASMRDSLSHVVRLRDIWLLGLLVLGFNGCVQGALGYLPLYLRGQGWTAPNADGASSLFHLISLIFVLPIAIGTVQLGARRAVLLTLGCTMALGIATLSVANGGFVFAALALAGMTRDGFMAVFLTTIIDVEGVGTQYIGTANGVVMACSMIGNLISPPIGNSLSKIAPGVPFLFWAGLALVGLYGLRAVRARQPLTPAPEVAR